MAQGVSACDGITHHFALWRAIGAPLRKSYERAGAAYRAALNVPRIHDPAAARLLFLDRSNRRV
jgi:hypothetical protein